jgi:dTDP-4-dehydrorhamnose 3,5-epimerase
MLFSRSKIHDVILIKPEIILDERGYFFECFKKDALNDYVGEKINFVQENESFSSKGVLRGLHYQLNPFSQSKLVRVVQGRIIDVAVDIRKSSPTFGKYVVEELSDKNKAQLFIPKGFAHGFAVLSKNAVISYKVDNYYSPTHERGIAYNDTELKIDWRINNQNVIISQKDKNYPQLSKANDLFA